jgi:hypothetical protein
MNDGPPVRETFAGLAAESDSGIEELLGNPTSRLNTREN